MEADRITGEGHFDDGSNKPSGAATPVPMMEGKTGAAGKKARKSGTGTSKKAKTAKQRLMMADGDVEMG
jgi:DNA helicase INO80